MATKRQVEATIRKQHPANAVTVLDGRCAPPVEVGSRPALEGGGAVLVFLDLDPDALGIRAGSIGLEGLGR